ncbi:MAG: D-cysteine desulfhydrase family protein [Acidimicrobiia bacterium]|nr:D-cysteine desulfhydrase family protein [Acidimicrobiia bacterium]MBV8985444.1 D-cysteine desulfhydrase family protein [Acidimicrobiia bacterium]MBV9042243.1 D-cysteine desulfhydrase family protein [Acidimicrobiia bacterium]
MRRPTRQPSRRRVRRARSSRADGSVDRVPPRVDPLDRRVVLAHLPTPLEPMRRLAAHLDMDEDALWVKRDDATGLAGGGNKARKLEYLCEDATVHGCDTLVTGGGPQSNHVRMTAAAANKLGLHCTIVLSSDPPSTPSGNVVLDELLAPEIVWVGRLDYYAVESAIDHTARRLIDEGRRPYAMPIGGASVTGAMGYVRGAQEIVRQQPDVDLVVTADGSGGTHAGLAAGLGSHDRVLGVDVGARPDLDTYVPEKATETARLAGLPEPTGDVRVDHEHFGKGYGAPTDAGREALDLAARLEGLILDPVYTGKAMAGLIAARRDGRIERDTKVVFLHTGGMPALFASAYAEWVKTTPPSSS